MAVFVFSSLKHRARFRPVHDHSAMWMALSCRISGFAINGLRNRGSGWHRICVYSGCADPMFSPGHRGVKENNNAHS
jgi:hypothetical protein